MASKINKTVLDNGIRVLTNRMPHVHSISMGVWANVGARDETSDENGLSHFIEHMIFKGTKRRTSYQIAKEFDAIGGHSNAFTSMENTYYHSTHCRKASNQIHSHCSLYLNCHYILQHFLLH